MGVSTEHQPITACACPAVVLSAGKSLRRCMLELSQGGMACCTRCDTSSVYGAERASGTRELILKGGTFETDFFFNYVGVLIKFETKTPFKAVGQKAIYFSFQRSSHQPRLGDGNHRAQVKHHASAEEEKGEAAEDHPPQWT